MSNKSKNSQLVSIIVPVYNAESFLKKCIDSLLQQTYKNIEIVLVNDGSSDQSESICLEYASKDSRVVYIKKENGGASTARNKGVSVAKGTFIMFCDADDAYFLDAVEILLFAQEKYSATMVIGGITNRNIRDFETISTSMRKIEIESALEEMYYGKLIGISAFAKLYKREILEKYPYREGVIHEDTFESYNHLYEAKDNLVVVDRNIYFVNQENESISRSRFHPRDLVYRDAMYENLAFLNKENFIENKKILSAWSFMYIIPMLRIIDKMIRANYQFDYTFYKNDFRQYSNLFFLSKRISLKHKLKYIIFMTSFQLYKILFNR
ncbi:TPA: glycosyltransferase family 2 protein [Streptococcus suis]